MRSFPINFPSYNALYIGLQEDAALGEGRHPNDLGFHKMADHIERVIVWALENHTT